MAAGKLQEVKWIPQRPVTYPFQNVINIGLLSLACLLGLYVICQPVGVLPSIAMIFIVGLALAFGVLLVIPIGGADMPTVISILNAYAGLSAVATASRPREIASSRELHRSWRSWSSTSARTMASRSAEALPSSSFLFGGAGMGSCIARLDVGRQVPALEPETPRDTAAVRNGGLPYRSGHGGWR